MVYFLLSPRLSFSPPLPSIPPPPPSTSLWMVIIRIFFSRWTHMQTQIWHNYWEQCKSIHLNEKWFSNVRDAFSFLFSIYSAVFLCSVGFFSSLPLLLCSAHLWLQWHFMHDKIPLLFIVCWSHWSKYFVPIRWLFYSNIHTIVWNWSGKDVEEEVKYPGKFLVTVERYSHFEQ